MCETSKDAPYGTPIERWRLYREYLQHEDDLIHQRLNWMLLLQGFLFAAYASMYSGLLASPLIKNDPSSPPSGLQHITLTSAPVLSSLSASMMQSGEVSSLISHSFPNLLQTILAFSFVLPVLGYLVGLFSLFGVQAARHAIKELEARWKSECLPVNTPNNAQPNSLVCDRFPGITGGGKRYVDEMDSPLPFGIPIVLCLGWTVLGMAQAESFTGLHRSYPFLWGAIAFVLILIPLIHLLRLITLRICREVRKRWRLLFMDETVPKKAIHPQKPRKPSRKRSRKRWSPMNVGPNLAKYARNSWHRFVEYTEEEGLD